MIVVFGIYLRGNNVNDIRIICKEYLVMDYGEKSMICKSVVFKRKFLRDMCFWLLLKDFDSLGK